MHITWLEYVISTVTTCMTLYVSLAHPQTLIHITQGLFVSLWLWLTIGIYRTRRCATMAPVNRGQYIFVSFLATILEY